jgi:DNA repair exonuclease SbcCD ATPase subunit
MDIKKIIVEDFRVHKKAELELGKVTAVTGPNGSGKSSLIEAPATCLLGENTWTARDGISLRNLIRADAKQATVSVMGKRLISRVVTPKGAKLVLDSEEPVTQAMLLEKLKVTEPQLRASLIPQAFLALPAGKQKEAIFDLLAPKFTMEDVATHVPKSDTWDKIAARWSKEHEGEEQVDLDALYKFVYEARKNYKAKGKTQPAQENPRQKELVARISEIAKKIASANFENAHIRTLKAERELLPQKEKELASLRAPNMEALKKEWEELDSFQRDCERKLGAAEAVLKQGKVEGPNLASAKAVDGKVVCPMGLSCPHDEKTLADRKNLVKGLQIAKEAEIKSCQQKLRDAEKALASKREEIRKAEETVHRIEVLKLEVKKLKELGPAKEPVDVKAMEEERKAVERELASLTSAPAVDETVVANLDAIVDALNVNGIKTSAIQKAVAGLEEEVNEAIARFGAWRMQFFVEGEFAPTILGGGGGRLLGELSDGERAVVSLVIQDVFSRRSGTNLVVVDNIDLLDEEAHRKFFEVACTIKSKVLVGTTNASLIPKMDGVTVVSLAPAEKPARKAPVKKSEEPPVEDLL